MNTQTHNQKKTIQIQVPAKWDLAGFDNDLYVEALQRSIIHRLKKSNQELDTVLSKILLYTSKYGTFDTFSQKLDNSFNQHDDWIEWAFLEMQKHELIKAIDKYNSII